MSCSWRRSQLGRIRGQVTTPSTTLWCQTPHQFVAMDFVNVLRGLKKSRSEAKLGLSDRLSVGRKSSKTRIKTGGGGGAPIGDIPEDSTAPSLHSPPPPARQPYSQTGEMQCNTEWTLPEVFFANPTDFSHSIGLRYSNLLHCFSCGFLRY